MAQLFSEAVYQQAGETGKQYREDRMEPLLDGDEEGKQEQEDAPKIGEVLLYDYLIEACRAGGKQSRNEIRMEREQQCCSCDQANRSRTYHSKSGIDIGVASESCKKGRNNQYQNERWQADGYRSQDGSPYIACDGIAYVCGTIDADGAGCHLADGNNVRELLCRDPTVVVYHFILNQRQHGIASTETE